MASKTFTTFRRAPYRQPRGKNRWDGCIELKDYGWVPNDRTDLAKTTNDTAIATALAAARAAKKPLYIGDRGKKVHIWHSVHIRCEVEDWIRGDGPRWTVLAGEPVSTASGGELATPTCNLRFRSGVRLESFTHQIVPSGTTRGSLSTHHNVTCVYPEDVTGVTIDGVEAAGGSTAAFLFYRTRGLRVIGCEANGARADGFHFTEGCRDTWVNNTVARACGDDGLALVDYGQDFAGGRLEQFVSAFHSTRDGKFTDGRGVMLAGGRDVTIFKPYVVNSVKHCLLVNRDTTYGSCGTQDWAVIDAGLYKPKTSDNHLVDIVGATGSTNGSPNDISDGFLSYRGGGSGTSGTRGFNPGNYVRNLEVDLTVERLAYGVNLAQINNFDIRGSIKWTYYDAVTCVDTASPDSSGYLRLHDLTLNGNCYGGVGDIVNLTGQQLLELSELSFRDIAHTLGTHPSTGSAVSTGNIDYFIDLPSGGGRSYTRIGVTTTSGETVRDTGWTAITS